MPENTEALRAQLIELLKRHDWTYGYSDDYSQWTRGREERQVIRALVAKVPDGQALYDEYRPEGAT